MKIASDSMRSRNNELVLGTVKLAGEEGWELDPHGKTRLPGNAGK